jgi:hypothetical protein
MQVLFRYNFNLKSIVLYSLSYALLLLFIIQILQIIGYDLQDWFRERLFKESSLQDMTRFKAIYTFLQFFPKYYLFGNGQIYDNAVRAYSHRMGSSHIHVGYLSHLVAYGITGCFLLYGFWLLLALKLFKTAKLTNYWGSFFAFLTFWWAFATFSQPSIFYYGLIFALVFDKFFTDQKLIKHDKNLKYEYSKNFYNNTIIQSG